MAYERFSRKVASNIKKARLKAGLTQEDMERFQFNIRHYQDIESGKVRFTLETLYRLSKAFKIKPEQLLK
jgi:transcriptional regulator with XRE-family HTH domain